MKVTKKGQNPEGLVHFIKPSDWDFLGVLSAAEFSGQSNFRVSANPQLSLLLLLLSLPVLSPSLVWSYWGRLEK